MGQLTIRWIGQGGYLFSDGDTTICIDPYLSDVVNRVAGRPRLVEPPFQPEDLICDVVVCTHNHLDHVDIDAIPRMKRLVCLFWHLPMEKKLCAPVALRIIRPLMKG